MSTKRIKDQFADWQRQEDEKANEEGVINYSNAELEIDRRILVLADLIDQKMDLLLEEIRNK